jgi:hypothetical protein
VISAAWRRGAGRGRGGDGASAREAGQSVLAAVSAAFHGTTCGEYICFSHRLGLLRFLFRGDDL